MTRGFTLLEMMVVLFILSLLAGLSGLAVRSLRVPQSAAELKAIERVRADAIASGRAATWVGDSVVVRFRSNGSSSGGRVVTPAGRVLTIDPITGGVREAQ